MSKRLYGVLQRIDGVDESRGIDYTCRVNKKWQIYRAKSPKVAKCMHTCATAENSERCSNRTAPRANNCDLLHHQQQQHKTKALIICQVNTFYKCSYLPGLCRFHRLKIYKLGRMATRTFTTTALISMRVSPLKVLFITIVP